MAALRGLSRARGLTSAAVVTLALGIAATTLMWSFVDALVLRPLPFGERTARLVTLHSTHATQAQDWDDAGVSYADLLDLRERSRTLAAAEGLLHRNFSLAGSDASERVLGASVTPGLFAMLGVEPELGRGFRVDDGAEPGHEAVVLLGHALWQRRFGGDPAILGKRVSLNGRAVTVVGVMPAGFRFPELHDVWLPYAASRDEHRERRALLALALLQPGASEAAARQELAALAAHLAERHPETNRGWGLHLMALRDYYVEPHTRRMLTTMLAAVTLVLLVACANVAGLLLARGIGRHRELTVRAALGAGRWRLLRLLLAESLLLALAGAALGAWGASAALRAFVASNPDPPAYWVTFAVDGRTLLFVVGVALLTTFACGLVPGLRVSRLDLRSGIAGGRSSTGGEQRRLQTALVLGQIAAGLALLVTATLLAGSARRIGGADLGFDPGPLLSLRLYLAGDAYDEPAARAAALERVNRRLAALPGVTSVAAVGAIPGDDGGDGIRIVPDRGSTLPGDELGVQLVPVAGSFLATLGLQPLAGRLFTAGETVDPASDVTVVSSQLAAELWPGGDALGRRLAIVGVYSRSSSEATEERTWLRVVGVAPDLVYEEVGEETTQSQRIVYVPAAMAGWRTMALLVRADGDPAAAAGEVPRALREVDPALAPFDLLTMVERNGVTHWGEILLGRLFTGFAATGLLLSCIGSYGLMAFAAARRHREMGLRLAVGATAGDLLRLHLRKGARLAAGGVLLGLPLAALVARALEGTLYGVSAWDLRVWLLLPALLMAVVLAACYLPARRASLTEPAAALRAE
jgi:predicted permease